MQTAHSSAARAQQQAQWLLWQMGSVTVDAHSPETAQPGAAPDRTVQTVDFPGLEMRRGRYESVVRRMQQAGQRTGTYKPWN